MLPSLHLGAQLPAPSVKILLPHDRKVALVLRRRAIGKGDAKHQLGGADQLVDVARGHLFREACQGSGCGRHLPEWWQPWQHDKEGQQQGKGEQQGAARAAPWVLLLWGRGIDQCSDRQPERECQQQRPADALALHQCQRNQKEGEQQHLFDIPIAPDLDELEAVAEPEQVDQRGQGAQSPPLQQEHQQTADGQYRQHSCRWRPPSAPQHHGAGKQGDGAHRHDP